MNVKIVLPKTEDAQMRLTKEVNESSIIRDWQSIKRNGVLLFVTTSVTFMTPRKQLTSCILSLVILSASESFGGIEEDNL